MIIPCCDIGKQVHASHKAKNIVSMTRCLELLHMDLFGPSSVRSYKGNRYILVIVDDYSRKVKESLNVTFDETPPPSKPSPLVDDNLDEKEEIKVTENKNLENDIEDETLEIDKIVNIKESRNHPLENIIGNLNQRTLRLQAQNQSNFFCFISTIDPKNVNEALTDDSWIVAMQEELNQFIANDVWELVPQPRNMTIIGTKWVFRNKLARTVLKQRPQASLSKSLYSRSYTTLQKFRYNEVNKLQSAQKRFQSSYLGSLGRRSRDDVDRSSNASYLRELFHRNDPEALIRRFETSSVNSTFNEESLRGLSVFKNVRKSTKDGVLGTAAAPIHMVATEGDLNSTFGLSQVEILFKDEATEEKGEHARMASFVGAMAIADLVKTTLGPKGMDKILQSTGRGHSVIVTNDGATILKSLHIDNPAAEVLIDISKVQDDEDTAWPLTVLEVHCWKGSRITRKMQVRIAYIKDNSLVLSAELVLPMKSSFCYCMLMSRLTVHAEKFRSDLMKIAMTTLSSKILSQDKEHFATLAVNAVMRLKGSTNLESIQIIKKAGGSLKDSFDTVLKLDNRSSAYSCQLNMYVGNIDSFTFRRGDITMLDINLFVISHEKHTGTKIITYH
ncbi:retrovirus-related pol polyprotein from transposon TNT 1-94 [Tanacetum coccineum]|uniref:Retrovirus-related pol polyprotein from transposon TNT 1-94 n=1 Tax=Tanacetum coccineum TaxID=301880 RepID=A0ABQ5EB88_9ASTR